MALTEDQIMKIPGAKEAQTSGFQAAGKGRDRTANPYTSSQPELREAWFFGHDKYLRNKSHSFQNGAARASQTINQKLANAGIRNASLMHRGEVVYRDGQFSVEKLSTSDYALYRETSLLGRYTSLEYAKEIIASGKKK